MFTLRILDIKVQWQKKILLLKLFEQQHTQVFLNKIFRRLKKGFRIVIYIENIIYYRNGHIVAISVSRTCTSGRIFLIPVFYFFPKISSLILPKYQFFIICRIKRKKKKNLRLLRRLLCSILPFPIFILSIDLHLSFF